MVTGKTNSVVVTTAVDTWLTVSVYPGGYSENINIIVSHITNPDTQPDTQTGNTGQWGRVKFNLRYSGIYSITCETPEGGHVETKYVDVDLGESYDARLDIYFDWTYAMDFDPVVFQTDPTGCLTYAEGCEGYTPVSAPPSTLGPCAYLGQWDMASIGTSVSQMLNGCFYATFVEDENHVLIPHEKLDPKHLGLKIAVWDNTVKGWVKSSGASSITTEDTMFCIPTMYLSSTETRIRASSIAENGTAFAHTIDNHTYQYLAIAVYLSTAKSDGKEYSLSGVTITQAKTRAVHRAAVTAKTVQNGKAMLWNFDQWNLWRLIVMFAMKSFNGQTQIGQGGFTAGQRIYGHMDDMGPFAGSTTTSAGAGTGVKAFIEDGWGNNYVFIDDFVNGLGVAGTCYIGQNSIPDDTSDNKVPITLPTSGGYGSEISTDARTWGIPTALNGSASVGLCDYFNGSTGTAGYVGVVGGAANDVPQGQAGPSFMNVLGALNSQAYARMAFVFDLE